MRLLNLFKKKNQKIIEKEVEAINAEFSIKQEKVKALLAIALENYNSKSCQCAFPRFQQLVGLDCAKTGNSFMCFETELLISQAAKYFVISESSLNDECTNKKWTCRSCNSIYEFGWSDFSIHISREKLELIELKVELIGKLIKEPLPLFMGLIGHSYPSKNQIIQVELEEFKKYILEE